MKYLLILLIVDNWDIPSDAISVTPVTNKNACELAAKKVVAETRYIKAICVSRE